MQRNCCHVSLAFVLKLLNFLQAFFALSIIMYSVWMLDQWNRHIPVTPPPFPAPSPESSSVSYFQSIQGIHFFNDMVHGLDYGLSLDFNSFKLPAPWFIYSFMGVGIILCCVTLIGCIAAEAIHGCCLCFYSILKILLLLLEAALVAFIAIDRRWEKDLPFDPTGELQGLRSFIEENVDVCKWVGITVVFIQEVGWLASDILTLSQLTFSIMLMLDKKPQIYSYDALALLLALVLRAMVSTRKGDFDYEDDYESLRGRIREPLLNQSGQASGSGTHSDIWSSRIREKYGLNSNDKTNSLVQSARA